MSTFLFLVCEDSEESLSNNIYCLQVDQHFTIASTKHKQQAK